MAGITLTSEVYNSIESELDRLLNSERPQIVQRLAAARAEGDLKENGGYQAARSSLRMLDTHIKVLKSKLANAEIKEVTNENKVQIGQKVTVELDGELTEFVLGDRVFQSATKLPVFGPDSPLGKAILNCKVGTMASYVAPSSKKVQVKIVKIQAID
jgi:transcription elongation factor GreA